MNLLKQCMLYATLIAVLPSSEAASKHCNSFFLYRLLDRYEGRHWCPVDTNVNNYDFIIVGGGSAGAVVANRLSQTPRVRVLLLEAGNEEVCINKVPVMAASLTRGKKSWNYEVEKQNNVGKGMVNGSISCPSGKALGGSSVINFMIYCRGKPYDYDNLAKTTDTRWAYKNVFKYYLKQENAKLTDVFAENHGKTGEFHVQNSYQSQILDAFIKGGQTLGYSKIDYNSKDQIGFSAIQGTINKGKRWSAASAFLKPIKNRSNLDVYTDALVTKILIEPKTKTAYGVEFIWNGATKKVTTKKEIIISAGAVNSPRLLMLSGVGIKADLEALKVPVVANLPVGTNLHDHAVYVGLVFGMNEDYGISPAKCLNPANILQWNTNGTGPITSLGGVGGIAFIAGKLAEPKNVPNIELLMIDAATTPPAFNIDPLIYSKYWGLFTMPYRFTIYPIVLMPKSTGEVKLRSADSTIQPIIRYNYFTDPNNHDAQNMVEGIRAILKLVDTPGFQKLGIKYHDMPVPGCETQEKNSDEYWHCAIQVFTGSLWHPGGTCKMGRKGDPTAVVDDQLRVIGINNLRVIDSSIIPFPLRAHYNAPSMVIGDVGSDIIKQKWGL